MLWPFNWLSILSQIQLTQIRNEKALTTADPTVSNDFIRKNEILQHDCWAMEVFKQAYSEPV